MTRVVEITNEKHVEDVIILGKLFRDEHGPHLAYDPDWIRRFCGIVMSDFDRAFRNVFIAYKDDEPIGFLVCFAQNYCFSPQITASQELWFVKKEYRGSRAGFKLVKAFEEWARLRGAVEIFTGVAVDAPEKSRKISDVLTRMGYKRVGTYHKKRTV